MMSDIPVYVLCVDKSKSPNAGLLAECLGAPLLVSGVYPSTKIKERPLVINYGRSVEPVWYDSIFAKKGVFVNKYDAVANCVDKLKTVSILANNGIQCPLYYSTYNPTLQNHLKGGKRILVRTTMTGSGGKGIRVVKSETVCKSLLKTKGTYATMYFPKSHEYRVHVAFGEVISFAQKKRMSKQKLSAIGLTEANREVRNHKNGWVFAYKNMYGTSHAKEMINYSAKNAVFSLGLEFGAVDVMAKMGPGGMLKELSVAEVNTCPGLEATITRDAYVEAINKYKESIQHLWENGTLDVPGSELIIS